MSMKTFVKKWMILNNNKFICKFSPKIYHEIEPEENIYAIWMISEKGSAIFACLCTDLFFTFDM